MGQKQVAVLKYRADVSQITFCSIVMGVCRATTRLAPGCLIDSTILL